MMVVAVQGPSRDESGGQTPAGRGQTDNCLLMVSSPHCVPTMETLLLKVLLELERTARQYVASVGWGFSILRSLYFLYPVSVSQILQ